MRVTKRVWQRRRNNFIALLIVLIMLIGVNISMFTLSIYCMYISMFFSGLIVYNQA